MLLPASLILQLLGVLMRLARTLMSLARQLMRREMIVLLM